LCVTYLVAGLVAESIAGPAAGPCILSATMDKEKNEKRAAARWMVMTG
jgi:hypothetical protein